MKKLANVLVKYRLFFFIASVVLALLCALLIPKVTINKDQSKYLAKDSNMSQGLEIINVILKTLILGEYIYSNGSLLNVCGCLKSICTQTGSSLALESHAKR